MAEAEAEAVAEVAVAVAVAVAVGGGGGGGGGGGPALSVKSRVAVPPLGTGIVATVTGLKPAALAVSIG